MTTISHVPAPRAPGGTGSWDSRLGSALDADGCRAYDLEVAVHLAGQPAGKYTFMRTTDGATPGTIEQTRRTVSIGPWEHRDLDELWGPFQNAVCSAWNDKLWLATSGSITGCHRGGGAAPLHNLKCGIRLTRSSLEEAQLRVLVLFDPHMKDGSDDGWRSNCFIGGRAWDGLPGTVNPVDMTIVSGQVITNPPAQWQTSDHGLQSLSRNVVAHEFGHYLGLHHTCASSGASNSSAQYCIGGPLRSMRNIMSVGDEVTRRHGRPWLERLPRHNYRDSEGNFANWQAQTVAPPPYLRTPPPRRTPTMSGRRCD